MFSFAGEERAISPGFPDVSFDSTSGY